jgi:hypothetical protein
MPIHLDDVDVVSKVAGLRSALIVPCNMCPAVTVAVREKKSFMQFFRNFLKSAPFEQYIKALQTRLRAEGVSSRVFKSNLPHAFFVCMWTKGRRKKLAKQAEGQDALIVLGCDSATETVRSSVKRMDCKVIQGMEVAGLTNARLSFQWPCNVSFEDCKVIPMPGQTKDGSGASAPPPATLGRDV